MYARNLAEILHQQLADSPQFTDTLERFERLRGHRLLPRGRENAGTRLTDEQIASAVLGFTSPRPGRTGLVARGLGDLRPVGGRTASFRNTETLLQSTALLVGEESARERLVHLSLTIAHRANDDEYQARLLFEDNGERRSVSYVSKMALTLLREGAEKTYDHEQTQAPSARQLLLGREFFRELGQDVALSRQLDRPLQTDWREYETEEERNEFHRRLGARRGSSFLNIGVDTQATWPKEPTRIQFAGHHLVLFPKTKENSHSISIDLVNEHLTMDDAHTLINRLLSILSWCDDQHAILHEGWSGNPVPVPVPRRNLAFATTMHWYFSRSLPENEDLLQRLAYFREGLNAREAGIASYQVLAFYKVFERRQSSKHNGINHTREWIKQNIDAVCRKIERRTVDLFYQYAGEKSPDEYIFRAFRVATAHAAKDHPSDADSLQELRRLTIGAEIIHSLARHFIRSEFNFSDSYLSDTMPSPQNA